MVCEIERYALIDREQKEHQSLSILSLLPPTSRAPRRARLRDSALKQNELHSFERSQSRNPPSTTSTNPPHIHSPSPLHSKVMESRARAREKQGVVQEVLWGQSWGIIPDRDTITPPPVLTLNNAQLNNSFFLFYWLCHCLFMYRSRHQHQKPGLY